MTVRVARVADRGEPTGWTPDADRRAAALESPVRAVLEPYVDVVSGSDRVTVVPDAHYPFNPSTGMVADPAVVGSIVRQLERWTDADVVVAGASDDRIAFDRTVEYLGYRPLLERFDADLVDLVDEPSRSTVETVDGERISVSVPERLLDGAVVVVPTLRPTEAGPVAGGVRTLGRLVTSVADAEPTAVAAVRAVGPAVAVLDATTVYGGEPVAADTLFAGPIRQVDAIAASLLGRSIADDPVVEATIGEGTSISVEPGADRSENIDLEALGRRIPDGDLPPPTKPHPAVSTAYRLYAAVAGDAVPPQLERRS